MTKKLLDINPELKVGDVVTLLYMKGEAKTPGLKGTVLSIAKVLGNDIISVDWEDGSTFNLLSDVDTWTLNVPKQIKEDKNKWWTENLDITNFDTKIIVDFLIKLRDSSITNMFAAAPYLYMGKDRIEHEFVYRDVPREEEFQEMLEMADECQSAMINGCIKILEKEKKELTIENINRYLQKYASKLLMHYINILS